MLEEPLFPDKTHVPQDADLARVLGRARRPWDDLTAHALQTDPTATPEWKYYSKKSGWTFVVRGKRRNLLYLIPSAKHFTASLVFGEKAVRAAERADLPADVVEMIRKAPRYPEGRAIRWEVARAADANIVKKLLAIKLES